ncbi:MAG: PQQ-dependent sugar dehydrogenase, partial [Planctomycetes bacterium]|nr:PQQ-dependent sugar dehydrogenase [Planctomycetota bacterium]
MVPASNSVASGVAALLGFCLLAVPVAAQAPVDSPFLTGLDLPVGFAFHGNDLMFVWERGGVVRVVDHGSLLPTPLLDIHEEVGGWRDFGMLGFALDPEFASNGYYYVHYVVDRHHLMHFGTPSYSPTTDEYFAASITRVTRFTADANTGFTTTVPGSRHVLLGESPGTSAVITHESHGACQLLFGRDGTLLVATGDGAHYLSQGDFGSDPQTYYQQALNDGMMRPEENVGAFRAQMVNSFSGKILRLDPATGDGVPSNPFFDPAQPRSARSRTYALGLRHPFRMCLRPGTGSTNPALGRPGVIYLGDVVWVTREELHVVTGPGQNLGWPLFEGIEPSPVMGSQMVANLDAPNPTYGTPGCLMPFFSFHHLLHQAEENHTGFFPHPCFPSIGISPTTPTFEHTPPVLEWHHTIDDARVPVFENGHLVARQLGTPASGIPGPQFHGGCSVGGCWHSGLSFPGTFGPCYYHADFEHGWIRRLEFDAQDRLLAVHDLAEVDFPMMLGEHPVDHSLVYVGLPSNVQLRKLSFGIEPPPTAVPTADVTWGAGAVEVQLDARDSFDPAGQPLTYLWDLGNGQSSTAPQLGVTYPGLGYPALQQVQLTVTDSQGASGTALLPIATDNTPPQVAITSFDNGALYSRTAPTRLLLEAAVDDAEHSAQQLTWSWRTALHHNTHVHPEPEDPAPSTSTLLSPAPVGSEFFAYTVDLTVTDAGGLATSVRHWLFPDSSGASTSVLLTSPASGDRVALGGTVQFTALTSGSVQRVEYFVEGELVGVGTTPPYAAVWTPNAGGRFVAMALAVAADGTSSNTGGIPFVVEVPRITKSRVSGSDGDAVEAIDQASVPVSTAWSLSLGNDGTPWVTGLRFTPAIPRGAHVQSAWIEFTAAQADTGSALFDLACDLRPTPPALDPSPLDLSSRPTGPPIAWSPDPWQAFESGAAQRTPDLTAVLQPQIDQPGWSQEVMFLLRGSGARHAIAWDGNAMVAPVLTVAWLPRPPVSSQRVSQADAAELLATGRVDLTNKVLALGEDSGAPNLVALRFALGLQAGAKIESAHLRFTAIGDDLGPAVVTIRAEASDDASPLSKRRSDLSTRPKDSATVTWYPPAWPTSRARGSDQRSPDLSELLQRIVDRPGWQGGNVVLLLEGSGQRRAAARDAGAAHAPRLELTVTANDAPTADAGPDQTVAETTLVTLTAAGSSDPEGQALSYSWTQTAGPAVVLSSTTAVAPTFPAPDLL